MAEAWHRMILGMEQRWTSYVAVMSELKWTTSNISPPLLELTPLQKSKTRMGRTPTRHPRDHQMRDPARARTPPRRASRPFPAQRDRARRYRLVESSVPS